jgi:hypothetical protein
MKKKLLCIRKLTKSEPVKKAFIITYYWPPSGGAGVQRWLKFAKYLRDFGWEPIIYTPDNPEVPASDDSLNADIPENLTVLRFPIWEPYSFYKKLTGKNKNDKINSGFLSEKKKAGIMESLSVWIRGNLFIPDARKFWIKPAVKFLTKYLVDNPVDLLITTGPPHSVHLIGLKLKQATGIKWLADFRDPWTGIYYYDQLKLSSCANRRHHVLEQKVLQQADIVTVVGSHMKEEFQHRVNRDFPVVSNGYDEADIKPVDPQLIDHKFSISHFGTIYPLANPELLWNTIGEKVRADKQFEDNLEIKLVGSADFSVLNSIKKNGLSRFTRKVGYLPHNLVISEMQKSQILLLLVNKTPQAKGILTGKLFEYLASRRPVICIGPSDGDAAKLINMTNAGLNAEYSDEKKMREIIDVYFARYLKGNLKSESRNVEQFSRRELTRQMADILNGLTN